MSATGKKGFQPTFNQTKKGSDRLDEAFPSTNSPRLLSGNEAIARAAWEAGVHVACGYPGTPSTEILETLSQYRQVKCEWSTNEKVAMEIAIGASFAGARTLVTMKHVGLNVAADPFFSAAYTGVNGGLVIISADDPGMHSSQNEQDNRLLAAAARIPILEPSSSQEARDFVIAAFDISEKFDLPVLVRTTTRIAHGKTSVKTAGRANIPLRRYQKQPSKNILLPSVSQRKHKRIETVQMPLLKQQAVRWIQTFEGDSNLAFVTSGASFNYVREAFPDASVMKLGMTYPLPEPEILAFAKGRKRLIAVEELEPFLQQEIAALGIDIEGKNLLPRYGELSVDIIRDSVVPGARPKAVPSTNSLPLPPRPPVMCAGCSHRGTFYPLKQLNAIVAGDVGCYTLGALAPLEAIDCSINMGASISMAHGMEKVLDESESKRLVAVIGDSTFFHSGITALIDVIYNDAHTTTIILDNHTSAMTGHQPHPGSGVSINGDVAKKVDIEALCRSLGVASVRRSNPYDLIGTFKIIDEELHRDGASVIIADAPCTLKAKQRFGEPLILETQQCTKCFACTRIGCPAIELEERQLRINPLLCVACGHCSQVCSNCNTGLDIPLILELMHQKRYREAFSVILQESPFPAISARVCPHPCEKEVNALGQLQGKNRAKRYPELLKEFPQSENPNSISIHAIERFLGDYGIVNIAGEEFAPAHVRRGSVAIVGSGPAGLSAAWHLRRNGFQVTVFDSNEKPGGMLRYGIPEFRLPRDILDAEIERLFSIGIKFLCGKVLGNDLQLEELKVQFDAVILAIGETSPKEIALQGARNIEEGLSDGLAFLHRYNSGDAVPISGSVAIIGGGNTAMDCARCARRLGAKATIYYRRGKKDMHAYSSEIEKASREGVEFKFWSTPTRLLSKDAAVSGLVMAKTRPGTLRQLFEISTEEFTIQVGHVIIAIGEQADLDLLTDLGVANKHGMDVNFMGATPDSGVFGCGDAAFCHGTVTQAIATGKRAAESVKTFLQENNVLNAPMPDKE